MTQADIQRVMASLKVSEAEAVEILKADEAIDDGEKLFEQTAEQKKASKAMTTAGGGKHKEKAKRERKVDADKHDLMNGICEWFSRNPSDYTRNGDTEVTFEYLGNTYTIKLIKHRKPKEEK